MYAPAVLPADYQERRRGSHSAEDGDGQNADHAARRRRCWLSGEATAAAVKAEAGIPLEIVKRSDTAQCFYVLPKRWIVERTFGWLGRCRRLAKDFENLTRTHAAFVILAMIRIMLRRLVRA
jgi:transposase